eukprot:TRINITY_DN1783_c0_g2_i1.p1 TRINITY_DN1783_c0_g2~~TRINITY_DN1783_c0_g2_i1.p1  ORF type:complete len:524 (+),score=188.06 TRINITY_DN1783_c0_g2_i1:205-1776(+)
MPMNLYAQPDQSATKKILVASAYAGLDIEVPKGSAAASGKFPVLETSQGCVFSSTAIARYISRLSRLSGLYGQNVLEGGMIDSWLEFCTHELEVPLTTLVEFSRGTLPEIADVSACAKEDVEKALTILNNHLLHNTFMVGHQVTLADITVFAALSDGMASVLDDSFRKPFGNLMRWFKFCQAQPEFVSVYGSKPLASAGGGAKAAPAAAKKEAAPKKAAEPKKGAAPKAAGKASPKAAPAKAAGGGDVEKKVLAVGDQIRVLKEKLKADGLSGKKINDHEEVKRLVEQLNALKAEATSAPAAPAPAAAKAKASPKQEAKKEKGGGKKDAKAAEEPKAKTPEEVAEERKKKMKKVVKEGGKRGVEIEGAADMGGLQFFCTSVDEPEGDIELMDLCMTSMNAENKPDEEERKGCSGHIGKMIFSAGVEQLGLVAYLPPDLHGKIDAMEWMQKVVSTFAGEVTKDSTKAYARGIIKGNADKGVFPLKIKEPCITEAISYLKSKGLFPDNDDDSDEMVFGDDDFPSM